MTSQDDAAISRHYVRVNGRLVHYRRAGSGPAVILLHQTPQSSKTMEPLLRRFASGFTAIALDSPGFGQSERLPGDVWSMQQLGEWLAATLDALGIRRAAFCGQHTGATIAADFAVRWPQRVACLALDGYTVFSGLENETVLPQQLYRFTPAWDGSHLVWAWSRFRDGWMFFPWSVRTRATRRDIDLPDAERIQSWQIMELLRSRENHLAIYPPVFAWDGLAAAQALRVPALLADTQDDQLYPHLDRLHDLPANVEVLRLPGGAREAVEAAQVAFVRRHADDSTSVPAAAPEPAADEQGRLRTYAAGLAVQCLRRGAAGETLLLLHGAGECSEQALQAMPMMTGRHDGPIVAIDLPGHGDSGGEVVEPATAARRVADAVRALGLVQFRVWGRGLGAAVAVELACIPGAGVTALELEEMRLLDDAERAEFVSNYASPIVPAGDGTHLIRLWNEIRDREFFVPWFRRRRDAIRAIEPDVDAERLTQRLFAALCCSDWPGAHRAWFQWPASRVAEVNCAVEFSAAPGDGWARDIDRLRALTARPAAPLR